MSAQADKARLDFIEVADIDLDFRTVTVSDTTPTGSQILSYVDVSPREEYIVLHWLASGDLEEIRPDETVNIAGTVPHRFIVTKADRLFRLVLDDRSLAWPKPKISEAVLRQLGQVDLDAQLYLRKDDGPDQLVERGANLSLAETGVENVYSKRAAWKLNVQGVVIQSVNPTITVRNALVEAGFDPNQAWIIVLKTSEAKRPVGIDETVDLRAPGIEKLRLTPRDINNGESAEPKREFRLLPVDEKGLGDRGLSWETLVEAGHRWLLLRDYPLPPGYTIGATTIALEVPNGYPAAEIDMFYCWPFLVPSNGAAIPQTQATATIRGNAYQRWSRHRGPGSPWRSGTDNVLTHLALVDAALLREVEA